MFGQPNDEGVKRIAGKFGLNTEEWVRFKRLIDFFYLDDDQPFDTAIDDEQSMKVLRTVGVYTKKYVFNTK